MDDSRGGRQETAEERLDRLFDHLLQETRVMQTGTQLTAGFLLTLPFQSGFSDLDDFQRAVYLVLVALAGLTTVLLLTPVAVHRRLAGAHVKERVVVATHRLVLTALAIVAVLIGGIVFFTFDVVIGRGAAAAAGVTAIAVLAMLLLVLPVRLMVDGLPRR